MIVAVTPHASLEALEERGAGLPWKDAILEVRFDLGEAPRPSDLKGLSRPWIATCRRPREGGAWSGTEAEREQVLKDALAAGAGWVDLEDDVYESATWVEPQRRIISLHDLGATPSSLEEFVRRAAVFGADRIKVAARVDGLADLLRLQRLSRVAEGKVVAIGLGPGGVPSRVLFGRMGSPWTFLWAGEPDRKPEGLGMLDAREASELYAPALHRGESPIVYGVLAQHAEASIGPWVFNRVFRKRELPPVYLPLSTRSLVGLRETIKAFGIRGLSVTQPFKREVLPVADRTHPLVNQIGAANTLVVEDGGICAYNTDYRGIMEPVRDALARTGQGAPAVVLGAGGVARAAALALAHLGLEVTLCARRREQAEEAARDLGVAAGELPAEPPRVLVNATPVGSGEQRDALPVPESLLGGEDQIVLDTVYQPVDTALVRAARARGAQVIDGGEMYAVQARHQMHLFWSGLGRIDQEVDEATAWALHQRGYR